MPSKRAVFPFLGKSQFGLHLCFGVHQAESFPRMIDISTLFSLSILPTTWASNRTFAFPSIKRTINEQSRPFGHSHKPLLNILLTKDHQIQHCQNPFQTLKVDVLAHKLQMTFVTCIQRSSPRFIVTPLTFIKRQEQSPQELSHCSPGSS